MWRRILTLATVILGIGVGIGCAVEGRAGSPRDDRNTRYDDRRIVSPRRSYTCPSRHVIADSPGACLTCGLALTVEAP